MDKIYKHLFVSIGKPATSVCDPWETENKPGEPCSCLWFLSGGGFHHGSGKRALSRPEES